MTSERQFNHVLAGAAWGHRGPGAAQAAEAGRRPAPVDAAGTITEIVQ